MSEETNNILQTAGVDRSKFLAFHLAPLLLGVLALFPLVIKPAAKLGLFGDDLSSWIDDLDYFEFVLFGLLSLGPAALAFSANLRFSVLRYVLAQGALGYFALQTLFRSINLDNTDAIAWLATGGAVAGLIIYLVLGFGSSAVYTWTRNRKR